MIDSDDTGPFELAARPIHLGPGPSAVPQPAFTGAMEWYAGYGARHGADGPEGRLVAAHTFERSWTSWERHPAGPEVVFVVAGSLVVIQEIGGQERRLTLRAGEYGINPAGVWHTADVEGGSPCTALFITPGEGTEHRPR